MLANKPQSPQQQNEQLQKQYATSVYVRDALVSHNQDLKLLNSQYRDLLTEKEALIAQQAAEITKLKQERQAAKSALSTPSSAVNAGQAATSPSKKDPLRQRLSADSMKEMIEALDNKLLPPKNAYTTT